MKNAFIIFFAFLCFAVDALLLVGAVANYGLTAQVPTMPFWLFLLFIFLIGCYLVGLLFRK